MPHLHSIYLTDEADKARKMPWQLDRNVESFAHHHPGFKHKVYGDKEARAFIRKHFDLDVLAAYDEFVPYSYKANLLRYCLLYELGGIYADISVHFFAPVVRNTKIAKVTMFRDIFNLSPWVLSNSVIAAPAGLDLFQNCIRRIVEHVKTQYYGYTPLCIGGPNVFGAEVAKWGKIDQMDLGESTAIMRTNGGTPGARSFIGSDGRLVGIIAKAGQGLASMGSATQDNYNDAYARRKIYRSQLLDPDFWTHEHYRTRGHLNALEVLDEEAGRYRFGTDECALYGPYLSLDPGEYRVQFLFSGETKLAEATIDVIAGDKEILSAELVPVRRTDDGFKLVVTFSVDRRYENVEMRLFLHQESELTFDRMELAEIP